MSLNLFFKRSIRFNLFEMAEFLVVFARVETEPIHL